MVTAGETAADEEGTVAVEEVTETWTVVVTDHVIAVAVGVDLESVAGTIAKDLPGETAEDDGVQIVTAVTAALPDALPRGDEVQGQGDCARRLLRGHGCACGRRRGQWRAATR